MSTGKVTGLNGKGWLAELMNKRVAWLSHELQNGGRGLTWEELREKVTKVLPGGAPISERIIRKVAFGVENNVFPTTFVEARDISLPQSHNSKRWEQEREERRIRFINQQKARRKYSDKKKAEATETSVEHVRKALNELSPDMMECISQVKQVMRENKLRKLEIDVQEDGKANITVEPIPQVVYTTV